MRKSTLLPVSKAESLEMLLTLNFEALDLEIADLNRAYGQPGAMPSIQWRLRVACRHREILRELLDFLPLLHI